MGVVKTEWKPVTADFSKGALDASVRRLADFLDVNRREGTLVYPFRSSYPHNCCESVSLILLFLIEERYGVSNAQLIMGTSAEPYEHHFWVAVGDWRYDLTAHQFEGQEQIVGVDDAPLHRRFGDQEIDRRRDRVDRDQVIALYRSGAIPF